jgi:hypothetical protein
MVPPFRSYVLGAAVLAILACPNRSEADPVVITAGGVYTFNGVDLPGFQLRGNDSIFSGVVAEAGVICCIFHPGDVVTLNYTASLFTFPGQPTSSVVNGVVYPGSYLRGNLSFTAEPFVAPPFPVGSSPFPFSTPFTMTGQLSGFSGNALDSSMLFSVPVRGSGTATVFAAVVNDAPFYIGQGQSFQFEPEAQAQAPVPEPATIVLFGTGVLSALSAMRRRRRGKTKGRDGGYGGNAITQSN